jgi:sugar phosphate isomerase/epimerase
MKTLLPLSRREFLQTAIFSAAALGLTEPVLSGQAAAPSARWITSIRDAHLRATGEPSCWAALERLGVAAMEVQVNEELVCTGLYHPTQSYRVATGDDRKALQDELAKRGATITAFCMNNRLDERLEREVDWTRRLAQAADALQVRAVRIDVVAHKLPADQFLPFAIRACKQLCQAVQGTSLRLGIENHGQFTNRPEFTEQLLDGVGSERLGLTLDTMNLYWYGHPLDQVYEICEKFAPRVFHTHCKNLRYPEDQRNVRRAIGWEYEKHAAPLYDGDIDYGRVAAILRKANYRGDLCLENECLGRFPKEEHVPILKREIATLQRLAA